MKNQFSSALFILAAGFCLSAQAATERMSNIETEDSWAPTELQVDGFTGTSRAYLTDAGTTRIEALATQLSAAAVLVPPDRMGIKGEKFVKWCSLKPPMSVAKREQKSFKLVVKVNPFANALVQRGRDLKQPVIENLPQVLEVNPRVLLQPGSRAGAERTRVQDVEWTIKKQLDEQKSRITETGEVELEFVGMDDLACDLIEQKAWLSVWVKTEYQAAKQTRTPIISGEQLAYVYNYVKDQQAPLEVSNGNGLGDAAARLVLSGANLGVAMTKVTGQHISQFGLGRFMSIYRTLFQLPSARLVEIPMGDYKAAARSLDLKNLGNEIQSTEITQLVRVGSGSAE